MSDERDRRIAEALDLAQRSPSAHNTKPWRVERIDRDTLEIHRDPARTLDAGDPTTRQATIACGIFGEALVVGGSGAGIEVQVENVATLPRITLLGRASFGELRDPDAKQAAALKTRCTSRLPYGGAGDLTLPDPEGAGIELHHVTDAERPTVAELVGEAMRLSMSLPALRAELASLVSWRKEFEGTGMCVEDLVPGIEPLGSASDWWLNHLDVEGEVKRHAANYATAPTVAVLASECDDPMAWFEVGRVALRTLAVASSSGLAHDIAAGPIEIPPIVAQLRAITAGARPQLLFRLGAPER